MKIKVILLTASLVFLFCPVKIHAQQTENFSPVGYDIPYPGLLPNHPLYFLKTARDGIIDFFLSKPLKKADFDLLQADKRIEASYLLLVKDKTKVLLAEQTLSKGENYFENGLGRLDQAKKQGMDITDLAKKYALANKKHQEIMRNILKEAPAQDRNSFSVEQKRLSELEKNVKKMIQ